MRSNRMSAAKAGNLCELTADDDVEKPGGGGRFLHLCTKIMSSHAPHCN
jgi:hypothetical protein